jgi:hypothetical protein
MSQEAKKSDELISKRKKKMKLKFHGNKFTGRIFEDWK